MITAKRTYRGVAYLSTEHELASSNSVEHIYRGKRYQAPLKHEAALADPSVKLNYRGKAYQHRQNAASEK